MKYCINYYGEQIELLNTIDEINIDLSHINNLERDLLDFCELHKEQRINLIINDYNEAIDKKWIPYIFDFQQELFEHNIYIRLPYIDDTYYPALKEKYKDMKFYLNVYAKDWDIFTGLIAEKVSDIFITDSLGFDIENAAVVAHQNGIQVRVFPNVAQSTWNAIPALKKFWIRPEDMNYYEDLIDTCEFYGTNQQQSIFYTIYAIDQKWSGNLNDLIIDLNEDINSMCLLPRFGEKRVHCNHRCQKGYHCEMCDVIFDLSKKLEENKIRVKIDKEE